jgi:hypothetical protein
MLVRVERIHHIICNELSALIHYLSILLIFLQALSRATELKLLTLRGFSEKAFRAHPLVKVRELDVLC